VKIAIQYVNDSGGNIQTVRLQLSDWEILLGKMKKYEQSLKLKSELKQSLVQVLD
jgi:hypothetical protein